MSAIDRLTRENSTCGTGLLVSLLVVVLPLTAEAHPVSISRASVYLKRREATVGIEVFLEDLYLFHNLKPNGEDVLESSVIQQGIRLHEDFLRRRFQITDVEGQRFEPESVQARPAELPARGVPIADMMTHQLEFELRYVFPSQPDVLTFAQLFTDEKAVLPSEMKLQVKQEGAGAAFEHTLLPHEPYSLRINWDNPPLSPEASEQQRADWAAREKQSLLGITSDSGVYSFLYVEDFEVRHEILIPLMTLADDLAVTWSTDAVLEVADQETVRSRIEAYFLEGNRIVIDDQLPPPKVQRCEFYGLNMKDFAESSASKPVPLANARVGIILSYHLNHPPQRLRMAWDRFNSSLRGVTTVLIAGDDVIRQKLSRTANRNVLEWTRSSEETESFPLQPVAVDLNATSTASVPWITCLLGMSCVVLAAHAVAQRNRVTALLTLLLLACAGTTWPVARSSVAELSEEEALRIFAEVHANLYRSFQRPTEESVYDALAMSVNGDLLQEIYLEVQSGMVRQDQGGASAKISDIDVVLKKRLSSVQGERTSCRIRCRWNVSGTVEHWGHVHRRTNQYEADFVLSPVQECWKFTDMDLRDEQHVDTQITLRSF